MSKHRLKINPTLPHNPTQQRQDSGQSPLRVIGEVTDWQAPPEQYKAMQENGKHHFNANFNSHSTPLTF